MKKIAVILSVFVLAACSTKKSQKEENNPDLTLSLPTEVDRVVGIGKIEPKSGIQSLASGVGGIVQTVNKETGDSVKKGDIILILQQTDAGLKIGQLQSKIATARQQIQVDETKVKEIETQLRDKKNTLTVSRELSKTGAETQQNVTTLITDKEVLETQLENSKKLVELSKARLGEAQSDLKTAQNNLNILTIKAPHDGVLLSMDAQVGGAVQPLQEFAQYAIKEPLVVHGEVDELFANRIALGQTARIKFIGRGETIATGKIIYLAHELSNKSLFTDMPGEAQDRRVRRFKVQIDQPGDLLLNNKVECEILLK